MKQARNERSGRWRYAIPGWLLSAGLVAVLGQAALGQTAGGAPAAEVDGTGEARMTFLELLVRGGWFMVPIGLCSLVGLTIIIERLVALRKSKILPPTFMPGLTSILRRGALAAEDRQAALDYCRANECPVARLMAVGIRKLPQGQEAVEQAVEDAGANEVGKLRRNLRALYGVSAVSPMLGLLGTVWGMIAAFQIASVKGLGKAELLASGIYQALITTLAGLMVAIPVLVFYYYFLGKIDRIISEMNDASEEFLEELGRPAAQRPASSAAVEQPAAPVQAAV